MYTATDLGTDPLNETAALFKNRYEIFPATLFE